MCNFKMRENSVNFLSNQPLFPIYREENSMQEEYILGLEKHPSEKRQVASALLFFSSLF